MIMVKQPFSFSGGRCRLVICCTVIITISPVVLQVVDSVSVNAVY
jgi:hypothetical protein